MVGSQKSCWRFGFVVNAGFCRSGSPRPAVAATCAPVAVEPLPQANTRQALHFHTALTVEQAMTATLTELFDGGCDCLPCRNTTTATSTGPRSRSPAGRCCQRACSKSSSPIRDATTKKKPRKRGFFRQPITTVRYCAGGCDGAALPVSTICIGSAAAGERGGRARPRFTGSSVT